MVEQPLQNVGYREKLLLFQNIGKGWKNVSAESGPILARTLAGRGMASGDFDNDGFIDVLIAQNDDAPVLLQNHAGRENHWLGLKLVGRKANIDAIGAKVTYQAGDLLRHQWKSAAEVISLPTTRAWCLAWGSEKKWIGSK